MGCWNETCALSHLPIKFLNDVKFIILFEVDNSMRRGIYYNDEYAPLCLPMTGQYNDYGSIENIDVNLPITLELLKNLNLFIKDEEYLPYEFETLEKFLEDVSQDEVYFYYAYNYRKLRLIMYHQSLFDLLVDSFSSRIPYNHTKQDTVRLLWENKIIKHYEKYFELNDKLNNCTNKDEQEKIKTILLFRGLDEPIFKSSQYSYNFVREYEKYLSRDNFDEYIEQLIDYIMFSQCMDFGRQGFFSNSGTGSQDNEMYIQKLIAEWTISYIENVRKDEEWEILEDDEDIKETVFWYGE